MLNLNLDDSTFGEFFPQDTSVTFTVCSIWFGIRNAITVIEVFVTYFSCVFFSFQTEFQ
jgi:hypothetical protein